VEKLEIANGTLGVLGFAFAPFKALSVAIDALSFGTSAGHSYVTNDPTSFAGHLAGRYGTTMIGAKASAPTAIRAGIIVGNVATAPATINP